MKVRERIKRGLLEAQPTLAGGSTDGACGEVTIGDQLRERAMHKGVRREIGAVERGEQGRPGGLEDTQRIEDRRGWVARGSRFPVIPQPLDIDAPRIDIQGPGGGPWFGWVW